MQFIKDIPIDTKTKAKIVGCVEAYMKLFPVEYEQVKDQVNRKRWLLEDAKFGKASGDHVLDRALHEIPESLDAIIIQALSEDEIKQFRSLKGARWFANKFKEFRSPEEV